MTVGVVPLINISNRRTSINHPIVNLSSDTKARGLDKYIQISGGHQSVFMDEWNINKLL